MREDSPAARITAAKLAEWPMLRKITESREKVSAQNQSDSDSTAAESVAGCS
jgi:hypothetical protein